MLVKILVYLVQSIFTLYATAVMLRFILQLVRADFFNPISQAIVKITNPPLKPLRKIIPGFKGLDLASLLLAWLVLFLQVMIIFLIATASIPNPLAALIWSLFGLGGLMLNFYFIALIALVIVSWVAPQSPNPAIMLLYQVTEPICAPFRKLIPPVGGLDLSIILVFLVLGVIRDIVLPAIANSIGLVGGVLIF